MVPPQKAGTIPGSKHYFAFLAATLCVGMVVHFIAEILPEPLHTLLSEFGLFLSASVVVHAVYFLFIKKEEDARVQGVMEALSERTATSIEGTFGGVQKWGFVRFHDSIDPKSLLRKLQRGDELCWLDTFDPSIDSCISDLMEALARGAKVRILALDPGSEVAPWRSRELGYRARDLQAPRRARELGYRVGEFGIRHFLERIGDAVDRAGLIAENIVRKYSDLPGIPMHIVISRPSGEIHAYTGFHLNKPSQSLVHIEWTGREDDKSNAFVTTLLGYFNEKWERSAQPDLPDCSGEWDYFMQGADDVGWKASGNCRIDQLGRIVWFVGERLLIKDEKVADVSWRSQWSELSVDERGSGKVIIRIDYSVDSPARRDAPAFARVEITEHSANKATEMRGHYFMLQADRQSDGSRFGTLQLVRTAEATQRSEERRAAWG